MRSLVFLALLVPLVGCSRKPAVKVAAKTDDAASTTQQAQPQPAADKPKGANVTPPADLPAEKKNWVGDPRFAKNAGPDTPLDTPPGKQGWGITTPPGGWDGKNPPVPPAGNGGNAGQPAPMGAVPPAVAPMPQQVPPGKEPKAPATPATPAAGAKKAVTKADMNDVFTFMDAASLASGKMPGPDVVYAALLQVGSPAAPLVKDGTIALSGTRARESVWAFEKDAATNGGWIVTQNGPEQVTAAEFTRRATGR